MRDSAASLLKAVAHRQEARHAAVSGYDQVPASSRLDGRDVRGGRFEIDNWRWAGVPIFIRAGKRMPVTAAEAIVEFKRPPREAFGEIVSAASAHMRFRISPNVTVALGARVKTPGDRMVGEDVELILTRQPGADVPPYQRLLGDAMDGNSELFTREDIVDAEWRIVNDVLGNAAPLYSYAPGTWGPNEAGQLIGDDGPWLNPAPTRGA
jgi:glucose-6-phosphate 1-dehydrogenase